MAPSCSTAIPMQQTIQTSGIRGRVGCINNSVIHVTGQQIISINQNSKEECLRSSNQWNLPNSISLAFVGRESEFITLRNALISNSSSFISQSIVGLG
ncbi:MAG: hypothetical protein ACR2HS_02080, partial [Gammaproteobacteria bacterium]